MTDSSLYTKILLESDVPGANLLRFCLSDNYPVDAQEVLSLKSDPIVHASQAVNKRLTNLVNDQLRALEFTPRHYTKRLKELRVYDALVSTSLMLRLVHIYPENAKELENKFRLGQIYLLCVDNDKYPVTIGGGLSSFERITASIMKLKPDLYRSTDAIFLSKTAKAISNIETSNWLFWDKNWQVLFDRPALLKSFRCFLHACVSSFMMEDEHVNTCYNLSKEDLVFLMSDLIELKESSDTKSSDIIEFAKRLFFYFEDGIVHPGFSMLLEKPFYWASMFFTDCNEDLHKFHKQLFSTHMTLAE